MARSAEAAKMLASRARRRVRSAGSAIATDLARQRAVVFLAPARDDDMAMLRDGLDPGVVVRADAAASLTGARSRCDIELDAE